MSIIVPTSEGPCDVSALLDQSLAQGRHSESLLLSYHYNEPDPVLSGACIHLSQAMALCPCEKSDLAPLLLSFLVLTVPCTRISGLAQLPGWLAACAPLRPVVNQKTSRRTVTKKCCCVSQGFRGSNSVPCLRTPAPCAPQTLSPHPPRHSLPKPGWGVAHQSTLVVSLLSALPPHPMLLSTPNSTFLTSPDSR